ncbi:UPF0223 family protein [Jeotgalibaca caeni]|uniref:UPF0223 family protein n=1 Tax=Jeotgalibaca caeni TaxID=3028623 RepID=UPI00237DBE49|nr:UPF0223 family protein [Jeotgalibaca caeni]MDE1548423.1 UPF0223 family protein [Jeotgalibaca caeni]
MQDYQYPIDLDWTPEEMNTVVQLWVAVEMAYEKGIRKDEFLTRYLHFKEVVPSKGEEKRYGNAFEKESGYSLYQVVKMARETERDMVKMSPTQHGKRK